MTHSKGLPLGTRNFRNLQLEPFGRSTADSGGHSVRGFDWVVHPLEIEPFIRGSGQGWARWGYGSLGHIVRRQRVPHCFQSYDNKWFIYLSNLGEPNALLLVEQRSRIASEKWNGPETKTREKCFECSGIHGQVARHPETDSPGPRHYGLASANGGAKPLQGEDRNSRGTAKLSPELTTLILKAQRTGSSNARVQVIVQFRKSPTIAHIKKATRLGGVHAQTLRLVRAGVFNLSLSAIQALAKDPEVTYISPNRTVGVSNDYYEQTVGGDIAHSYGWDGTGIGVAVIDSGVSDHPDLYDTRQVNSRVVYSQSFVPGSSVSDGYGHGTHVAGIISGNGWSSYGTIFGVAPNVNIINLKVLDGNGAGSDSGVIAAIQRAIALKSTYNIRVINLSLGRRVYESYTQDPLCQAVEVAWKSGLVVVVAAGNFGRDNSTHTNGYGTIAAPGNDPYVITVGAMRTMNTPQESDDRIATYSSKGPSLVDHIAKPDLVAPGNKIASLLSQGSTLEQKYPGDVLNPITYGDYSGQDSYIKLSGTSMATPVVSGAAVLMLQKSSGLNPDAVKARLMKTADKMFPTQSSTYDQFSGVTYSAQYDIFTVGAGYLNIPAALSNNDTVSGTAMSPVAVRNLTGTVSLQADSSSVWSNSVVGGNSLIWGTSVVWGNSVLLNGTSVIWGSSVVWGNSALDGCSVIWGSSVVWGATLGATDAGSAAESIDGSGDDDGE